jgi:S1-C subfamily serine protease
MIDLEPTNTTQEPPAPKKPSNLWPIAFIVAVFLISVVGIFYLFTALTNEDTNEGQTTGTTTQATEQPSFTETDEPVADAAEVILPSVVQISTPTGVGSGVIYDSDGLILTAAHVVEGQSTVTVRFDDGEQVEGTVIGGAAEADVAVVQVDRTGLPAATLALDEDPRVGQLAIAVGSPWGLQSTVTAGIVSAVNQTIDCTQTGPCRALLQTDAAINPGNSGGALVDRFGRVLGINVSIFTLSGANDGVGFAVPIDVANDVAQALVSGEPITTAFLGVSGENVQSGRAGAVIIEVTPGSGADEAGIEVDDLIVSIDGVPVQGIADLASQVRSHRPGDTVDVVLVRDGQEMTVSVTLGEASGN